MQIIHWLFKGFTTCSRSQEECKTEVSTFTAVLKREDINRACIMGLKGEAVAAAVGCKVLPICDAATMASAECGEGLEKEAMKRRKALTRMKELLKWAAATKSAKAGIKGWKVMYFRNKMALKDPLEDTSSSKISFRWDVGSCSTSSSVYSPMSMPLPSRSEQMWSSNLSNRAATLQATDSNASSLSSPKSECSRAAQWITTDSDFVVLEL